MRFTGFLRSLNGALYRAKKTIGNHIEEALVHVDL